jgi:hypothetical protein
MSSGLDVKLKIGEKSEEKKRIITTTGRKFENN